MRTTTGPSLGGADSLAGLRAAAAKDPKSAIKEAAKQFEALFMQELMKSMRSTTLSTGMMENGTTEMATGMMDTQYATQMSGRAGGLADAIARQLERQTGTSADAKPFTGSMTGVTRQSPRAADNAAGAVSAAAGVNTTGSATASAFVQRHARAAERVAAQSGIPANFMLGQAAHETGWGKRQIVGADGTNSHNLFGIKAGGNWTGPVVEATTTEVIGGQAVKVKARFRAYESDEASFRDYANLIGNSPRYAGVMRAGGDAQAFAQGLQQAGYATDPHYAAKLGRVIQTATRLQQAAQSNGQVTT